MKLEQIIIEGRDAPLYHITYLHRFEGIMQDDMLKGKHVSITRNPRLHRIAGLVMSWEVKLILDQRRLSQRYRIEPIDDLANVSQNRSRSLMRGQEAQREDEEIIFGPVKDLHRYLRYVLVRGSFEDKMPEPNMRGVDSSIIGDMYRYAKRHDVEIYDERGTEIREFVLDIHEQETEEAL